VCQCLHCMTETKLSDRFLQPVLLGHGVVGAVFQVLDKQTGQTVAVKVPKQDNLVGQAVEFSNGSALRNLKIDYLVEPLEACVCAPEDGETWHGIQLTSHPRVCMTFELCKGGTLEQDCERSRLAVPCVSCNALNSHAFDGCANGSRILKLMRNIAHALARMHAAGWLHNDVARRNIFLTQVGGDSCKLGDFGLCQWIGPGGEAKATWKNWSHGLAPEVARGPYSFPADIYALGVALLQSLLLKPRPQDMYHLKDDPADLIKEVHRLYAWPQLETLLKDMVEDAPARRPSAAQVLQRLDGLAGLVALSQGQRLCYPPNGVGKNETAAVLKYREAAAAGIDEGMFALGTCQQFAKGTQQDVAQAVYWYSRAATNGHAAAAFALGDCLHLGHGGITRDIQKAMAAYRQAAAGGNVNAMFALACCHHHGDGVPADQARALNWLQQAHAGGHTGHL
jgi:hypothetical protein